MRKSQRVKKPSAREELWAWGLKKMQEQKRFAEKLQVIREAMLSLPEAERLEVMRGAVECNWISRFSQLGLVMTIMENERCEVEALARISPQGVTRPMGRKNSAWKAGGAA